MRDPGPLTRTAGLVLWIAGLGGAVWLLSRMGTGALASPPIGSVDNLRAWADERDTAEIVMAAARLVALAMTWYLIALTVAGALARLSRTQRLTAATDRVTPSWVRALLDHALGIGLTGTAVLGAFVPSMVDDARRGSEVAGDERAVAESTADQTLLDGVASQRLLADNFRPAALIDLGGAAPEDTTGTEVPASPTPAAARWTIEAGDHLWKVAEETLREARGRPVADHEIDRYWRAVVELNRDVLVDRDNADLVYPGQVFELPPVD